MRTLAPISNSWVLFEIGDYTMTEGTKKSEEKSEELFAVFAEVDGYDQPLILTHLTFGRLMDDVVVPYESNKPFIIDGVSIKKDKLKRLKIIRQKEFFSTTFHDLHWGMRFHSDLQLQKLYADQYHVRMEALLRESGEDVNVASNKGV